MSIVYDPNNPEALWREWLGSWDHGDAKGNSWVFLNDEREVVSIITTDIDGEWVYGDAPNTYGMTGWDVLALHAKGLGVNNIICIHSHLSSDDATPCEEFESFVSTAASELLNLDLNLRAMFITDVNRLVGVASIQSAGAPDSLLMFGSLAEGVRLRKVMMDNRELTDSERETILNAIDNTLFSIIGVAETDFDLLRDAAAIAERKMSGSGPATGGANKPSKPSDNMFDLPSINLSDIKYMN